MGNLQKQNNCVRHLFLWNNTHFNRSHARILHERVCKRFIQTLFEYEINILRNCFRCIKLYFLSTNFVRSSNNADYEMVYSYMKSLHEINVISCSCSFVVEFEHQNIPRGLLSVKLQNVCLFKIMKVLDDKQSEKL